MKYLICREVAESSTEIHISRHKYQELLTAKNTLLEILSVEEKYDLLIRNYRGFEEIVHASSMSEMLYIERSWSDFIDHIQSTNLAVMNLLAMCRAYIDHTPQHLSSIFPDSPEKNDLFHDKRKTTHSNYLGYRALYEIRNHVQHCGLPVHSLTLGAGGWFDTFEGCRHIAIPYITISGLSRDKSFNKNILKELSNIGDKVDLRLLIRENMSAFGDIHKFFRELTEEPLLNCEKTISDCLEDFSKNHEPNLIGLVILQQDKNGKVIEKHSLFGDMVKRLRILKRKNKTFVNLKKHFVTGQIV